MSIQKSLIATLLLILFIKVFGNLYAALFLELSYDIYSYQKYGLFTFGIIEFIAIYYFVFRFEKNTAKNIFKTKPVYYLTALSLGLSFVFIQTPLNYVFNYFNEFDINLVYGFQIPEDIGFLRLLNTIIIAPIAEEIFFRHYLQRNLSSNYEPIVVILLVSALFSFVHLPFEAIFAEFTFFDPNYNIAYIAFFGGLLSALLYHKSKALLPSIIFHMCWNFGVSFFLSY